jgi:hypothetical protein
MTGLNDTPTKESAVKTKPLATPENWRDLPHHSLASRVEFGVGIDLEQVAAHMRSEGYDESEPIVVAVEDGQVKVLDGRHRQKAAEMAGVTPTFREFVGKNPIAFVMKKVLRQHLNESQRALFAAGIAREGPGRPAEESSSIDDDIRPTASAAAKAMNVSEVSVDRARTVLNHGTPEQIESVKNGSATVSKVAAQLKESAAVHGKKKGGKKKAKNGAADAAAPAEWVKNWPKLNEFGWRLGRLAARAGRMAKTRVAERRIEDVEYLVVTLQKVVRFVEVEVLGKHEAEQANGETPADL